MILEQDVNQNHPHGDADGDHRREDGLDGQNLQREDDLLDEAGARSDHRARLDHGFLDRQPGHEPRQKIRGVIKGQLEGALGPRQLLVATFRPIVSLRSGPVDSDLSKNQTLVYFE